MVLNLIGTTSYDYSLPNVMKWDKYSNQIAGDIKDCVDDLRAIGHNQEHVWAIARVIASKIQYLGSHDASRKRWLDHGQAQSMKQMIQNSLGQYHLISGRKLEDTYKILIKSWKMIHKRHSTSSICRG